MPSTTITYTYVTSGVHTPIFIYPKATKEALGTNIRSFEVIRILALIIVIIQSGVKVKVDIHR